jgi:hypothetical protein
MFGNNRDPLYCLCNGQPGSSLIALNSANQASEGVRWLDTVPQSGNSAARRAALAWAAISGPAKLPNRGPVVAGLTRTARIMEAVFKPPLLDLRII